MKHLSVLLQVFIMIVFAGLLPAAALAEGDASQKEAPAFSNRDLEKYRNSSDSAPVSRTARLEEKERPASKDDKKEKMYWCGRAREHQKRIDRAKDEMKDMERPASRENVGQPFDEGKLTKQTRKKYEKAKKDLRDAERDLAYLEDEARRKDIPPGWLRCQFE